MSTASTLRTHAIEVLSTLRAHGHEAYFAGGCVRDLALGILPKDYDIATSARPEEVLALFAKAIPVGIQFGVVRVVHHQTEFEVATFRADGEYEDGRHPSSVRWASAREDVLRRDFTINGLLEDPLAPEGARIIDFVDGLADLERGIIRAIGEAQARFEEDYLRILRAIRFAARFGFPIESSTLAAMQRCSAGLRHVSAERISAELMRTLEEGGAALGFALLRTTDLLGYVLPELNALGDAALDAIEGRLKGLPKCTPLVGLALVLWDLPISFEDLGQRLRLSRQMIRDIQELKQHVQTLVRWDELSLAEKKRTLRSPLQPLFEVVLVQLGFGAIAQQANAFVATTPAEVLSPPPFLTGQDLKAAGFKPGPAFRHVLFHLETLQLNQTLHTQEAALALAIELLKAQA